MGTLKELIEDLARAGEEVDGELRKVVAKGALNIKNEARGLISGRAHLPHYPRSITYEVRVLTGSIIADIGPERDRTQGTLGDLLENGSINNAPIPHLGPALDNEVPRTQQYAEDVAEKLLGPR